MITRYWRGWTTPDNADVYQQLLADEILPSISARGSQGYLGSYLLRRALSEEVEFAVIMKFDSIESVQEFAGEDYEIAYVPPTARTLLKRFDERAAHYQTLRTPEQTRPR